MATGVWGDRADEPLMLVDGQGERKGVATRAECHEGDGLRHRAFSVYLFDDVGRLLVQRRQDTKPLWPGYWSNSCCSHPIDGEETADAAHRRVREELGVDVEIHPIHKYEYRAQYEDVGTEHEVVTVFTGSVEPLAITPDPEEVAEFEFIDREQLDTEILDGSRYTPWFQIAWPVVRASWYGLDLSS